jgi:hypothetical protein
MYIFSEPRINSGVETPNEQGLLSMYLIILYLGAVMPASVKTMINDSPTFPFFVIKSNAILSKHLRFFVSH